MIYNTELNKLVPIGLNEKLMQDAVSFMIECGVYIYVGY